MFAFSFGGLSIGDMGVLAHLAQAPLLFPFFGCTAFSLFHRPTASAASPKSTIVGHFIGVLCGAVMLLVTLAWALHKVCWNRVPAMGSEPVNTRFSPHF